MTAFDILKVGLSSLAFTCGTLTWVHLSRQTNVRRSIRTSLAIAFRIGFVHILIIAMFCAGMGLSVDVLAIPLLAFLVLLPFAKLRDPPAGNALEVALILMVMIPVYALKQFVLGFPDREQFILTPEHYAPTRPRPPADAVSSKAIATVVSTLKPSGIIEVNGERVAASTADGSLVEIGQTVQVCGERNGTLLVESIDQDKL